MLLHLLRSFNVLVEIKPSDLFGDELLLPGEEVTREGGGGGVLVQVVQGHAKHMQHIQAGHLKHLEQALQIQVDNMQLVHAVQVHVEHNEHVQGVQVHLVSMKDLW
jgi:hypothetical protein